MCVLLKDKQSRRFGVGENAFSEVENSKTVEQTGEKKKFSFRKMPFHVVVEDPKKEKKDEQLERRGHWSRGTLGVVQL